MVRGIHGNVNCDLDDIGPGDFLVDQSTYDGSRPHPIRYDDDEIQEHDQMPERGSWFGQDHNREPLDKILKF